MISNVMILSLIYMCYNGGEDGHADRVLSCEDKDKESKKKNNCWLMVIYYALIREEENKEEKTQQSNFTSK